MQQLMALCGLEMEEITLSLGSKELGINLFLMKKEAGYWKLKVILFNVYLPVCSFLRMLLPKGSQKLRQLWLWLKPLVMVVE